MTTSRPYPYPLPPAHQKEMLQSGLGLLQSFTDSPERITCLFQLFRNTPFWYSQISASALCYRMPSGCHAGYAHFHGLSRYSIGQTFLLHLFGRHPELYKFMDPAILYAGYYITHGDSSTCYRPYEGLLSSLPGILFLTAFLQNNEQARIFVKSQITSLHAIVENKYVAGMLRLLLEVEPDLVKSYPPDAWLAVATTGPHKGQAALPLLMRHPCHRPFIKNLWEKLPTLKMEIFTLLMTPNRQGDYHPALFGFAASAEGKKFSLEWYEFDPVNVSRIINTMLYQTNSRGNAPRLTLIALLKKTRCSRKKKR